jgi:hypothetical protein
MAFRVDDGHDPDLALVDPCRLRGVGAVGAQHVFDKKETDLGPQQLFGMNVPVEQQGRFILVGPGIIGDLERPDVKAIGAGLAQALKTGDQGIGCGKGVQDVVNLRIGVVPRVDRCE